MHQTAFNFESNLSPDEAAVLGCLSEGRERAVSSTEIERVTGLSERKIQQVVQQLRRKLYPIVGVSADPMGYFIAENQDEMVMLAESYFSRGRSYFATGSIFAKQSLRMIYQQETLKCEKEGESGKH